MSQQVFAGTVNVALNTPNVAAGETGPKIFIGGTLNFADNEISMDADLYADLSHVGNGAAIVYFLSDIPTQVQLLTLKGVLSLGFTDADGNTVTPPVATPTSSRKVPAAGRIQSSCPYPTATPSPTS